jgi:hypothetical protein
MEAAQETMEQPETNQPVEVEKIGMEESAVSNLHE